MDKTIMVPFKVWEIKCVNCGVSYSVIGHGIDNDYWPQQKTEYCPYCGERAAVLTPPAEADVHSLTESLASSMKLELINTNLRRNTFESPKIKVWVESNCCGLVLNLFAGKVKLDINEVRNDIDRGAIAEYNLDALDFVLGYKGELFDTVILDPPYSYRKSMEMYNGNLNSRFKLIADNLPNIIKSSTKVISFGYHSTFFGKKRGYELETLCVFAHGGAQHCTIGIIEKKIANHRIQSDASYHG